MPVALKVLVLMMSAPAARNASWMPAMMSGLEMTSRSLSPYKFSTDVKLECRKSRSCRL